MFPIVTVTLFVCVIFMLSVLILDAVQRRAQFLYKLRAIPYPYALPLVGNAVQLACTQEQFFLKMNKWAKKFGDIFLIWVGQRPFIFLYRMEVVQPLLNNNIHIDKSLEYEYLHPWLGTGLVTSGGEKWFFRRKLLTRSFHNSLHEEYLRIVKEEAKVFVSCLEKEVGDWFDVVPYAKRAALDIICDTAMGYKLNAQKNSNDDYVEAVNKIASIVQMRFTNVWISSDFIFKRTKAGREHDRSLEVIHSFVNRVLAERKATWRMKQEENNFSNSHSNKKKRQALLDLLLDISKDGAILSDDDIREEVNTFMYAGHDTVSTSIAWSLYALGRNPQYQEKILDEYDELVDINDITVDDINKLNWLDATIREQWRIYPVAPLIARQIYTPLQLGKRQIPPGSTVLINSYLLHRDPRFFSDPDVYRPERFMPGGPDIIPYTFIPFSAGSRNCIGWKFATLIIKYVVLSIIKAYHVEALDKEEELRFISELVLVNANGIRIKLTPRERYSD